MVIILQSFPKKASKDGKKGLLLGSKRNFATLCTQTPILKSRIFARFGSFAVPRSLAANTYRVDLTRTTRETNVYAGKMANRTIRLLSLKLLRLLLLLMLMSHHCPSFLLLTRRRWLFWGANNEFFWRGGGVLFGRGKRILMIAREKWYCMVTTSSTNNPPRRARTSAVERGVATACDGYYYGL